MRSLIQDIQSEHTPESLSEQLRREPGVVLLRSGMSDCAQSRYSFVTARPFLTLRAQGSECHLVSGESRRVQYGNPWRILETLLGRYELLNELDLPFPLGGCFGYWGYDLRTFLEPRLSRRAVDDLGLPDCHLGFHSSLVVFDHHLAKTWVVATGLAVDGSRSETRARQQLAFWQTKLQAARRRDAADAGSDTGARVQLPAQRLSPMRPAVASNLSGGEFIAAVRRVQRYIQAGDIYQVNLSQRLSGACALSGWGLFRRLSAVSPAPFAAYLDCGEFQVASSSPELFLRLSGSSIQTRPIKGTRPRSADCERDAQLRNELQTSDKERAELVMITDLLRNDLGRVCKYGSVQVPELARLERYAQVQHLVSTIEGRLRPGLTHLDALAACFPGGSITGAPKIRAMEIIDELEPIARGPYTGCLGYLGFNRESQLNIIIRTALCRDSTAYFHVGAGIVADSSPAAEYEETWAKARGFLAALEGLSDQNAEDLPRRSSGSQPESDTARGLPSRQAVPREETRLPGQFEDLGR